MKDFIKGLLVSLWTKHRKKLLAFVFGLLFAGLAAISGIPLDEIKQAAGDAANKPAPIEVPAVLPAPAEVK